MSKWMNSAFGRFIHRSRETAPVPHSFERAADVPPTIGGLKRALPSRLRPLEDSNPNILSNLLPSKLRDDEGGS
jgi:hypothetical protein